MNQIEAMKQALQALENAIDAQSNPERRDFPTIHDFGRMRLAYLDLRAAIEQALGPGRPVAVPEGWKLVPSVPTNEWTNTLAKEQTGSLEEVPIMEIHQCIAELLAAAPEAPQPQPKPLFVDLIAQHPGLSEELAEMQAPKQEPVARYLGEGNEGSLVQLYDDIKKGTDLYTAPQPQREWVGLTDEDVRELDTSEFWDDHTPADFVRLVENKLREKNGGGV